MKDVWIVSCVVTGDDAIVGVHDDEALANAQRNLLAVAAKATAQELKGARHTRYDVRRHVLNPALLPWGNLFVWVVMSRDGKTVDTSIRASEESAYEGQHFINIVKASPTRPKEKPDRMCMYVLADDHFQAIRRAHQYRQALVESGRWPEDFKNNFTVHLNELAEHLPEEHAFDIAQSRSRYAEAAKENTK